MVDRRTSKVLHQLGPVMNLGIEMVVIIAMFGAIGWFLDSVFDTAPVWMIVLLVMGSVGGMYRFIRTALQVNKRRTEADK